MRKRIKGEGKERLLDAAEALFARHGYSGASIRDITGAAGVEPGLVSYHFGGKDALFRSVMERRADELCGALLAALDAAEAAAGGGTPGVEAILAAYVGPHVDRIAKGDEGWRNYIRLGGHTAILEERDDLTEPLRARYAPVEDRYRRALRAALPGRAAEAVDTDFHIFRVTVATIAGEGGWRGRIDEPVRRSADEMRRALARLFASGFGGEPSTG